MLSKVFVLFLLIVWVHGQGSNGEETKAPSQDETLVVTPMGAIRGVRWSTRRGRSFEAYRGIRYAEPPIGQLRFKPPQPIQYYRQEFDATKEGPACPLPVPLSYYVDEDCLRLNVYTPRSNSSKLLPVIFYIHAGGFYSMAGRSDLAGPHYLLDRDVVLVTINYRIGSLGFLATGDEYSPGNYGMKDQVAALRWVQQNIASFGGDPNLVTLAGCSAGSISVMLHMISPMSKGLFHRAISMSAAPTGIEPTPTAQFHLAERQAKLVNCPTNSSKVLVDCLKTKSWREMGDSIVGFFDFRYHPVGLFKPVIEPDFGQERFLTIEPATAIKEGKIHAVPHIISQTSDEFYWLAYTVLENKTLLEKANKEWDKIASVAFLLPEKGLQEKSARLRQAYLGGEPLRNDEQTAKAMGKLYADSIIGFPVSRMAKLMAKYSPKPVYFYEFAYIGKQSHYEDPKTGKPLGAAHHDDLIYLFSLSYQFPNIPVGGDDSDMVDKMTAVWYNFARYGDPNPRNDTPEISSMNWPVMTSTDRKYLRFDKKFSINSNLYEDRFKLWEELYPLKY